MKMPVKIKRIELEGDYQGWWADFRTNPPSGLLFEDIAALEAAGKKADIRKILPPIHDLFSLVLHQWNFVDEEGKDLPLTKEAIKVLPLDLLQQVMQKVTGVIKGVK